MHVFELLKLICIRQIEYTSQPRTGTLTVVTAGRGIGEAPCVVETDQVSECGALTHCHVFLFCLISPFVSYPDCPVTMSEQTARTAKTLTPISPVRWQTTTRARWQDPTGKTSAAAPASVRSRAMRS